MLGDLVVIDLIFSDTTFASLFTTVLLRREESADAKLVHADMKFDPNASPQCYRSNDEIIQKDTKVRIQLVGCRMEQNEIFAIGTIKKDFLGQIRED
jgi:DNA-directed RNA polymerase subunit E'/Rpb7